MARDSLSEPSGSLAVAAHFVEQGGAFGGRDARSVPGALEAAQLGQR